MEELPPSPLTEENSTRFVSPVMDATNGMRAIAIPHSAPSSPYLSPSRQFLPKDNAASASLHNQITHEDLPSLPPTDQIQLKHATGTDNQGSSPYLGSLTSTDQSFKTASSVESHNNNSRKKDDPSSHETPCPSLCLLWHNIRHFVRTRRYQRVADVYQARSATIPARTPTISELMISEDSMEDISEAITKLDMRAFQHAFNAYPNPVFVSNAHGDTILHLCASTNYVPGALLAIQKGCRLHARNSLGESPLHVAVRAGFLAMVQLLIDAGADFEAERNDLNTVLHIAALANDGPMCDFLLRRGAQRRANSAGLYPIHVAASVNAEKAVTSLLAGPGVVHRDNSSMAGWKLGNPEASFAADASALFIRPLHVACRKGHLQIANILLTAGANPNEDCPEYGITPVHGVCASGSIEVLRRLVDVCVGKRALLHTNSLCRIEYLRSVLLEHGIPIAGITDSGDRRGETIPENNDNNQSVDGNGMYIPEDNLTSVNEMGEVVPSRESSSTSGGSSQNIANVTPLHILCCICEDTDILEELLKNGADRVINQPGPLGHTPFTLAAASGRSHRVLEFLVEHGARYWHHTPNGYNALVAAVEHNHPHVLAWLLQKDNNYLDVDMLHRGYGLLHIASRAGMVEIVRLLLEVGCDPHARAFDGHNAIHLAVAGNHALIVDILSIAMDPGAGEGGTFDDGDGSYDSTDDESSSESSSSDMNGLASDRGNSSDSGTYRQGLV